MAFNLEKRPWWDYAEEDIRELLFTSEYLINLVTRPESSLQGSTTIHDYSFIVFPTAKAYEGFLKKIFLDHKFITQDDYYGKRFRIGRALNPSLEQIYRGRESVYDKITASCGGSNLADQLWEAWKQGRNLVFHWFPDEKKVISIQEAIARIKQILDAMDAVFVECKRKGIIK